MDSLNAHLQQYLQHKKNPTSERAYLIQRICDDLFDNSHFKKILGQTKQFTIGEIQHIFDTARSWHTNPQALFWKLIREKQEAVQEQLNSKNDSTTQERKTS